MSGLYIIFSDHFVEALSEGTKRTLRHDAASVLYVDVARQGFPASMAASDAQRPFGIVNEELHFDLVFSLQRVRSVQQCCYPSPTHAIPNNAALSKLCPITVS